MCGNEKLASTTCTLRPFAEIGQVWFDSRQILTWRAGQIVQQAFCSVFFQDYLVPETEILFAENVVGMLRTLSLHKSRILKPHLVSYLNRIIRRLRILRTRTNIATWLSSVTVIVVTLKDIVISIIENLQVILAFCLLAALLQKLHIHFIDFISSGCALFIYLSSIYWSDWCLTPCPKIFLVYNVCQHYGVRKSVREAGAGSETIRDTPTTTTLVRDLWVITVPIVQTDWTTECE